MHETLLLLKFNHAKTQHENKNRTNFDSFYSINSKFSKGGEY